MLSLRRPHQQIGLLLTFLALLLLALCFVNLRSRSTESRRFDPVDLLTNVSRSLSRNGSVQLPGAIIVGARKAGTRALLVFLNLHPKVSSVLRELHYFSSQYSRGIEWYRDQMPMVTPGALVVEKCPDYLIHPAAPQRVCDLVPDAKIIIIVRDPVERAISDYCQLEDVFLKNGGVEGTFPKFEQLAFTDDSFTKVNASWRPLQVGKYTNHLFSWLRFFPREQILLVSGERLNADPAPVLADVQSFLGLEPLVTGANFHFSRRRGFWCYRTARDQPEVCLGKSKGRPHPQVHPDAIQALRRHFKPWNEWFYDLSGTDFHWPKPDDAILKNV